MFRTVIRELHFIGKLGATKVTSHGIETTHEAVYFIEGVKMWVIGFTGWPPMRLPNGNYVPSYAEFLPIVKLPSGDLQQGSVIHSKCTRPLRVYEFNPATLVKLYRMSMMATDLNITMFDMKHFDRDAQTDFVLTIGKKSMLSYGLHVGRLNCTIQDQGKIRTKTPLPNHPHSTPGNPVCARWCLDRLHLTLHKQGSADGIRVNVFLRISIPFVTKSHVACDIIANNGCIVTTNLVGNFPPAVVVKRQVSSDYIIEPPPPPFSSSEDEDSSDDDIQEACAQSSESLVEEKYRKQPKARFPMTSTFSSLVTNVTVKHAKERACYVCMEYRAVFCAVPCGCAFSCFNCLPGCQATLSNCPVCRSPIQSAIFSNELYNAPREAFPLSGPPAADLPWESDTVPRCLKCGVKVAQTMLACGHRVLCLYCAQYLQTQSFPVCPLKECNKTIEGAIVMPYTP